MKTRLLLLSFLFLFGCSSPSPVPSPIEFNPYNQRLPDCLKELRNPNYTGNSDCKCSMDQDGTWHGVPSPVTP